MDINISEFVRGQMATSSVPGQVDKCVCEVDKCVCEGGGWGRGEVGWLAVEGGVGFFLFFPVSSFFFRLSASTKVLVVPLLHTVTNDQAPACIGYREPPIHQTVCLVTTSPMYVSHTHVLAALEVGTCHQL